MLDYERLEVDRALARLAVPAMVQGLLFTLVFVVDTLMVARLGATAIAAVGAAGPVIWSLSSLLFALSRATTALVSQAVGAKRLESAHWAAGQSLVLAMVLGLAAAAIFVVGRRAIMLPFGLAPEVVAPASRYLAIVGAALAVSLPGHVLAVTFQAAGDTRTPLVVSAVGNVVNVVGDYVLIFGVWGFPALGTDGAALATATCRVVEFVLLAGLLRRHEVCPAAAHGLQLHRPTLRDIGRIGMPAVAEAASFHGGYLAFSCLVSWLGTVALASHRICLSIEGLAFMPATGLAVAAATHTGQRLGAGRLDLAELGVARVRRRTVQFMAAVALVLLAMPTVLVGPYTDDPAVAATAARCLRIGALELVPLGVASTLIGVLQGAGDTRSPLLVTSLGIWLVRVPLTALFGLVLGLGLPGVWAATALDWWVRAGLLERAVASGRWRLIAPEAADDLT